MACLDAKGENLRQTSSRQARQQMGKVLRYSQVVCGYVNARKSNAIVRATHLYMRASPVPVHKISIRYSQWEDGAVLSLFEC
jgi:hypothetical protein